MAINKEQWKEITAQLSRHYGRVELKCGARSVIFRVEQVKGLKLGIITYVDGEWRGEWLREESEIGKLFLCRREQFAHGPKARAAYIKAMGGSRCPKKHRALAEVKIAFHDVMWPSPAALRRHYSKIHPDAELVSVGYMPKDLDGSPMEKLKNTLASMGLYQPDEPASTAA
jgi:hypothetical protein